MAGFNPPLQVVGFVGTRRGDAERGPAIRLRSDDAFGLADVTSVHNETC